MEVFSYSMSFGIWAHCRSAICCPAEGDRFFFGFVGNYTRREGGRGSSWSGQVPAVTHRGTYSEPRGGQSNFTRGPLPSRQPPASMNCTHAHILIVIFHYKFINITLKRWWFWCLFSRCISFGSTRSSSTGQRRRRTVVA